MIKDAQLSAVEKRHFKRQFSIFFSFILLQFSKKKRKKNKTSCPIIVLMDNPNHVLLTHFVGQNKTKQKIELFNNKQKN